MDNQPWLDSVREQLARHALPPSYVQRFTAIGQSWYSGLTVLFMLFFPTVVLSLVYCKLAKRFGSGRKWMFVSCMVLATFAAVLSFQTFRLLEYDTLEGRHCHSPIGLTLCITLVQFVVPLTIGWWFMRRKHDQGQLELA